MFTFVIAAVKNKNELVSINRIHVCISEFEYANLVRICKTRNKNLYNLLNSFYDRVVEVK